LRAQRRREKQVLKGFPKHIMTIQGECLHRKNELELKRHKKAGGQRK